MSASSNAHRSFDSGLFAGVLALGLLASAAVSPAPLEAQIAARGEDPMAAGRFDGGKMWTFEYAPSEYFTETYGFEADDAWFDRVRLSVLRIPGCSASFVSPDGLVVTNHHCARGAIVRVQRPGENLLDDGFYAPTVSEERPIPDYYADQLIHVEDVTDAIYSEVDGAETEEGREAARAAAIEDLEGRFQEEFGGGAYPVRVQIIPLYQGGRYSAYVFRRYTDVRLVAAAELQLGFFGGDPDNFTYPRYALDFTFYRIYGADGEPLQPERYLDWGVEGVSEGDPVFVVGNPGPTSRGTTMAQLELLRDILVPAQVAALEQRLTAMQAFFDADPAQGEAMGLRNRMFSLSNSLKASRGRLEALHNDQVMARRADAESQFAAAIQADPELQERFGEVIPAMADLQDRMREWAPIHGAFLYWGSNVSSSAVARRAGFAAALLEARASGADAELTADLERRLRGVPDLPAALDQALLEARLDGFVSNLGPDHPISQGLLEGHETLEAARMILEGSDLRSQESTVAALEAGTLSLDDPAIQMGGVLLPVLREYSQAWDGFSREARELSAELGRARFAVFGQSVPPDATFSPRITDGVVSSYEYNGTIAPPFTTFFGLYDRHFSNPGVPDWGLPDRWVPAPAGLDLGTPLNFVSTADTYGGNSGSPAITPELEIVGLNFDRNIQGLSRDYIYLPEQGRNVMVDVRAILEALDDVYDADRIVAELLRGQLFPTEAEADALGRLR
jgi:hypothetical protein